MTTLFFQLLVHGDDKLLFCCFNLGKIHTHYKKSHYIYFVHEKVVLFSEYQVEWQEIQIFFCIDTESVVVFISLNYLVILVTNLTYIHYSHYTSWWSKSSASFSCFQLGDNTFVHILDKRLHDCTQFTCILVLCLCILPFQYTCLIYYVCAHFKFYT